MSGSLEETNMNYKTIFRHHPHPHHRQLNRVALREMT